jgi:hypothetical protein
MPADFRFDHSYFSMKYQDVGQRKVVAQLTRLNPTNLIFHKTSSVA